MALTQDSSTVLVEENNLAEIDSAMLCSSDSVINTNTNTNIDSPTDSYIDSLNQLVDATLDSILSESVVVVEEEVRLIAPRTILVISTDIEGNKTTLFEGESSLTKAELKAQYGDNIFVYYEQLYTTTMGCQTYDEATVYEDNFKKLCYTKEDFMNSLNSTSPDLSYAYITYSHKDLRKQQRSNTVVKSSVIKNNKVEAILSNFSLFLFTSMNGMTSFPIKGLSSIQITTAEQVLKDEDYFINKHVLKEGEDQSVKQQQESILFIVGTPAANDSYIKMCNLRWITHSETGDVVKGLIKNNLNTQTGIQVYLLRLNVWDKRQSDVFIHCNYTPNSAK